MSPMLKLLAATGVALLMTGSMTLAQPGGLRVANQGTSAAEEAVRGAELARFKAMMANDFASLGKLLGDDLIYTHSNALVDTKASYVESMTSGSLKYHTIESSDMKVRVYGTTAIITAAATMAVTSKGQDATNHLRYTDVWVLRDGRWQMVGWQSTKMP
jgi:ketosteroid isomerase-like protein